MWSRRGIIGEKVQRIRSINNRYKLDGEVKNSIGNREVKELICTTHGHELRGRECWRKGGCRMEGDKEEEKNGTTVTA